MRHDELYALLERVARGEVDAHEAADTLGSLSALELPNGVTLDTSRCKRTGQGEVIFGPGKSLEQLETATRGFAEAGLPVLATKLTPEAGNFLAERFPEGE